MGEIHRRYSHSFSPRSLYFEPALYHFQNKHLKTLGNAKYFSVLSEQILDSTEKTGAATRTESAIEISEDANSSEISEDAEASKEEVNMKNTGDIRLCTKHLLNINTQTNW